MQYQNPNTNFMAQAPREMRQIMRPRRWPYILLSLLLVLAIVAVLAIPYGALGLSAYRQAQLGKDSLERAQELAVNLELEEAKVETDKAVEHFTRASRDFSSFKILFWVPWLGTQIKAVDNLLVTGRETSKSISELLDLALDIFEIFQYSEGVAGGLVPDVDQSLSYTDLSPEERRQILKRIYESGPRLEEALIRIDLATESFDQIPQSDLAAPLREAIAPFVDRLPEIKKQLSMAVPIVKIIPRMAGYPEPKNYLFLMANNHELRPAGGFIGTYGILKLADGEIMNFDTHDIYAIDGPAESFLNIDPPPPINEYIGLDNWFMRDSNWSPDFPTSAENVLWFYAEEANGIAGHYGEPLPQAPLVNFSGVISMNPVLVADLLGVVGPITIDGQTFNSENFIDALEYQVEIGFLEEGTPLFQRKEIIGDLADELMTRLFNLPAAKWLDVIQIVEKRIEDKHVLIYEKDPEIQEALAKQNWDGRVIETDGDFAMVIDANMASYKTDPFVERQINYSLNFNDAGELIAEMAIDYNNTAGFSWRTTRYRTYTRVYAPLGSELIGVTGHLRGDKLSNPDLEPGEVDVYDELGKTVFGAFTSIEPKTSRRLVYTYKLPDEIVEMVKDGRYRLYFQKQAGTAGHSLTLSLDFDKNLGQAEPPEDQSQFGDDTYYYQTDLRLDREFEISF